MSIELALTPDRRWPVADAGSYALQAIEAGFGASALWIGGDGPLAASTDSAAAFERHGLACSELVHLSIERDEVATLTAARLAAEAAATTAAPWVNTIFVTRLRDESLDLAARVAEVLADAGTRLAIEFGPGGLGVGSITDALLVVEHVGPEKAGVVIDTWHFTNGPSTFDDLEAMPLDRLAYVQFCDAPPWIGDDWMVETGDRRVMPGDGTFELERFASILRDRGWAGLVTLEIPSVELSQLPFTEIARLGMAAMARYWC
ncbi:MAG: Xylose isomerase domain protein barrel [Actinomycetia bacterium]|nr:Xylose isomerase domain protein barrel [Actinomycetes bacterium]